MSLRTVLSPFVFACMSPAALTVAIALSGCHTASAPSAPAPAATGSMDSMGSMGSMGSMAGSGDGASATTTTKSTPRAAHAGGARDEARAQVGAAPGHVGDGTPLVASEGHALAAFAAGCFWGVEDGFRRVPGVTATAVGYTGGHTTHPTYATVCDHDTGHAETVLIEFDPAKVSYEKLLAIFFAIHDPTQLDRQGPDSGDQYRSAIFTASPEQETAAKRAIAAEAKARSAAVVTRISPLGAFWKAEDYHQQYSEKTGHHGCPTGKIDDLL